MRSAASKTDIILGSQVGNYIVKKKLGEGGMGAVYLAEHPLIGKKVALKVLHPEFVQNEDVVSRFFTEARSVNDIGNPNIVDIIDFGTIPPRMGIPQMVYFTMEFLPGQSLSQLLEREAPLAESRALRICAQIADALAASHRVGIVHRDLKPDNVLLVTRGSDADFVKVLDFGIAKLTGTSSGSKKTRTGVVMGTPAYMAPEQAEGKGKIDHRTDIYSLGIVLYELMTGTVPFHGSGYGDILVQHLTAVPPMPTQINPEISAYAEAVCLRALEKRPGQRYESMSEFREALLAPQEFVDNRGGAATFFNPSLGVPTLLAEPYLAPGSGSNRLVASSPASENTTPVPKIGEDTSRTQVQTSWAEAIVPTMSGGKAASKMLRSPLWLGVGLAIVALGSLLVYRLQKPDAVATKNVSPDIGDIAVEETGAADGFAKTVAPVPTGNATPPTSPLPKQDVSSAAKTLAVPQKSDVTAGAADTSDVVPAPKSSQTASRTVLPSAKPPKNRKKSSRSLDNRNGNLKTPDADSAAPKAKESSASEDGNAKTPARNVGDGTLEF